VALDAQTRRVVEATEGLCALMGASRADLLERKQEDLFAVQDRPRAGMVIDSLGRQPQAQTAEVALCSRSGESIAVELSAAVGPVDGLLVLRIRDRRSPAASLAGLPAMQEAERLEAVARLAGGVAHDLNNVLTAITSTADVLRSEVEVAGSQTVREGVEDLRSAASYGVGVARSLLQLTRHETQHHEPFDLGEVVRSATRLLERALPLNLHLRASVPATPCVVVGNPNDWERVLINLAFNASDACPGGGEVQLGLEAGEAFHTLSVKDNGAGMSPEVRARAFEPFFTTKDSGRGTGLGLAQVAAAAAAHQAQITLDSEPAQGTLVAIRIPASPRPLPVDAPPPLAPRAVRLLLVEDEPIVRKSLARRLRHLGLDVEAVPGGEEALAAVSLRPPQVVLTDLSMPGMDGLTLLRRLKETHPSLPVVVMSGHVAEALRPQLEALHVRQLDKPFGERELGAALEAVLPPEAVAPDKKTGESAD
jgi:signal transduction histidine kinase/CheY-like chemotaxis protein